MVIDLQEKHPEYIFFIAPFNLTTQANKDAFRIALNEDHIGALLPDSVLAPHKDLDIYYVKADAVYEHAYTFTRLSLHGL